MEHGLGSADFTTDREGCAGQGWFHVNPAIHLGMDGLGMIVNCNITMDEQKVSALWKADRCHRELITEQVFVLLGEKLATEAVRPSYLMSTISTVAGTTLFGLQRLSSTSSLLSGTIVEPILGSIVQNGKFAL